MRDKPLETLTIPSSGGPLTVHLYHDCEPLFPAAWADADGAYLVAHLRRYLEVDPPPGAPGYDTVNAAISDAEEGDDARWRSILEDYEVYGVSIHAHGGCTLGAVSAPDEYDRAYILVRKGPGCATDPRRAAEAVAHEWRAYLEGDVYGFVIKDADGEELDACWGIYGMADAREEARAAGEAFAAHYRAKCAADTAAGNLPYLAPDGADTGDATGAGDVP